MTKEDNKIREKIIKGLELSQKKLLQSKKDRNLDFIISKNGKINRIHAVDY
jgi:hypothetical protein